VLACPIAELFPKTLLSEFATEGTDLARVLPSMIYPSGKSAGAFTHTARPEAAKSLAPKHEFGQPIQRDLGRPDYAAKINRFAFPPNQLHLRASRLIEEGRTRRHDMWSAGSGGRGAPARARHCRAVSGFVLESVSD